MGHKYSMKFDKAKHKALHLARNSPSSGTGWALWGQGAALLEKAWCASRQ